MSKVIDLNPRLALNIQQAAEYLGFRSAQTLYNRICEGQGPRRTKRNGRWEFRKDDLDAYMKSSTETFEAFSK